MRASDPPESSLRFGCLADAWTLRRSSMGAWTGASIIVACVIAATMAIALGLITLASHQVIGHWPKDFEEADRILAVGFGVGVLATATIWTADAGVFAMALAQIRGEEIRATQVVSQARLLPRMLLLALPANLSIFLIDRLVRPPMTSPYWWMFELLTLALATPFAFVLPIMVDRGLKPHEAARTSSLTLIRQYPRAFAFYFAAYVQTMAGLACFFLAYLWTLPLFALSVSKAYEEMIGGRRLESGSIH